MADSRGAAVKRRLAYAAALILPALFVRGCVVATYAVRSDSMAPALLEGDHLLGLRSAVDPRAVQRWDVVLLDRSIDPELTEGYGAVVKRVVGLPGEVVALRGGDVYVGAPGEPLTLAVKPAALADAVLEPLHRGQGLTAPWSMEGVALRAPARAVFSSPLHDGTAEDPGGEQVRDSALRVVLVRLDGVLVLALRDGADVYRARLAADGGASLHHNLTAEPLAAAPDVAPTEPGAVVQLSLVDDRLRLTADGRELLAREDVPGTPQAPGPGLINAPELAVEEGSVALGEVVVLRDVHYGAQGSYGHEGAALSEVSLGPDEVFVLGDRSTRSHDSRQVGPVRLELLLGRPVARYRPWSRAGTLTPAGVSR